MTKSSHIAIFFLAAIFLLALLVVPVLLGKPPLFEGGIQLAGPDSYMRLVRIEDWWGQTDWLNGSWYDNSSLRSNSPYGEILHWTRPMDLLILPGALALSVVMPFKQALLYSGTAISPLLAVVALGLLMWGNVARNRLATVLIIPVLLMIEPVFRNYFLPARPDHHSLLVVLFIAQLVILLRMAERPEDRPRYGFIAGIVAGLAMWTSVEALMTVFIGGATLGLLWLIQGSTWLKTLSNYLSAIAATVLLALFVERPPADVFSVVEYDRLSVLHLNLFIVAALTWQALARYGRNRWLISGLGIGLPLAAMALMFPDFFKGPFGAGMDPRLDGIWLQYISEIQTLLKARVDSIAQIAFITGPAVIGLLWCWQTLKRNDAAEHTRALISLIALGVSLPLTLYQVRWGSYLAASAVLPWLWAMLDVWKSAGLYKSLPMRAPAFLGVLLAPFIAGSVALGFKDADAKSVPQPCLWSEIAPALNARSQTPLTIFTFTHQGSEILWRTPHLVVGSPYHRNTSGILDTYDALTGSDEAASRILHRRNADMVVFCKDSAEYRHFLKKGEETFFYRVTHGAYPDWLKPVSLVGGESFVAFEVQATTSVKGTPEAIDPVHTEDRNEQGNDGKVIAVR